MIRFIKRVIGILPAIAFVLSLMAWAPLLWAERLMDQVRTASKKEQRMTETKWQQEIARFLDELHRALLFIRMPIEVIGEIDERPAIVLFNHRGVWDNIAAQRVLHQLRLHDTRWVVKESLGRVWFVGEVFRRAAYAFVSRNGDPQDKERVAQMARCAVEDGASICLYPEGTRHDGIPKSTLWDGVRYRHLKDPKRGGLEVIRSIAPDYQIIFVCLDWRGMRGSRHLLDASGMIGLQGKITLWKHDECVGEDAASILEEGWTRMDTILAAPLNANPRTTAQDVRTRHRA